MNLFTNNSEKTKGIIALVFSALVGGALLPTFIKYGVETIDIYTFVFFNSLVALLIFMPFLLKEKVKTSKKELITLCVLIGAGVGLNNGLFPVGLQQTTIAASQLIVSLLPIFVPLMAYLIIGEQFSRQKLFSSLVAILGVVMLVVTTATTNIYQASLGTLSGNLIILVAILGMSFYIAISKKYLKKYSPGFVSGITYLTLSLIFLPFAIFFGEGAAGLLQASQKSLLSLVAVGILFAVFTGISQYGYKRVSAHLASVINMLALPFGLLTGILLFQESFSIALLVSILLVVVGVRLSLKG
jgi:drug/metabolite transporter (DMT)-like permease